MSNDEAWRHERIHFARPRVTEILLCMEQRHLHYGSCRTPSCAEPLPQANGFRLTCRTSHGGHGFTVRASGEGRLAGHVRALDNHGTRTTISHPKGVPAETFCTVKGLRCDM